MYLVVFIVASIDDNGRMVSQAANIGHAFAFDGSQDGRERRIIATTEHEILPDEYAQLVADVIENVFLPYATAPDAVCCQSGSHAMHFPGYCIQNMRTVS